MVRSKMKRVATVAKTVKLPEPLDNQLRRFCFEQRQSQQDIILAAIEFYLKEMRDV
jgi:hypothetical protein